MVSEGVLVWHVGKKCSQQSRGGAAMRRWNGEWVGGLGQMERAGRTKKS
jgi:hypothetical protein